MGGTIRMDRDGKNREVYATGMRNPAGMDLNSKDGTLWTNDNQVDGMGDDKPPGEMNRVTEAGQDFGFPYYGGGHQRACQRHTAEGHHLPGGRAGRARSGLGNVYGGNQIPAKYHGAIFSTQHWLVESHCAA